VEKIKATLKESLEYKGIHIEANTDLVFVFSKIIICAFSSSLRQRRQYNFKLWQSCDSL